MTPRCDNAASCWKTILSDVSGNRQLLNEIERFAQENKAPTTVVFGTSGWRGEIGNDFTFHNLRIVTTAIIELFKAQEPEFMKALGVASLDEIKERGIIVGHDNRFLGPAFAMEVIGILEREGIKTWYAGEATTPEFSTGIIMLNAACSMNLTPSHNPANYAGFKFNPADGGPAGAEITTRIEQKANRMMQNPPELYEIKPGHIRTVDLTPHYVQFIQERGTLDLDKICGFIESADCTICIDNVHGATRERIERIIGKSDKVRYLRTQDDFLFGGVAPEPSEKNMQGVDQVLKESRSRFKLGVIMDPDGDRIRHSDGTMQLPMNYFGSMAGHFLRVHKGFNGVFVKSVGTSNLINAIGDKLGIKTIETKVGFKNFRPYLLPDAKEKAIVAFEESDGITGYNHTLEKDAMFGLLLAIEMMATTGKNLSEYLDDIMNEYGHFYPDRSGISVDRSLVGEPLLKKLSVIKDSYPAGSTVAIDGTQRKVANVITTDGTKLVFDDGSWLMIRPSGTEPKVRFYIEARTEEEKEAVFNLAKHLTAEALGK